MLSKNHEQLVCIAQWVSACQGHFFGRAFQKFFRLEVTLEMLLSL
jgi:hypothetical protein